jgi:hypothetical protein
VLVVVVAVGRNGYAVEVVVVDGEFGCVAAWWRMVVIGVVLPMVERSFLPLLLLANDVDSAL